MGAESCYGRWRRHREKGRSALRGDISTYARALLLRAVEAYLFYKSNTYANYEKLKEG